MLIAKQISSLEKVRFDNRLNYPETYCKTALKGERFSYQIALSYETFGKSNNFAAGKIEVDSVLAPYIKIYNIKNTVMDCPITRSPAEFDKNYITKEPGLMPDILIPAENSDNVWVVANNTEAIWVEVNIPKNIEHGTYDINIRLRAMDLWSTNLKDGYLFEKKMSVEVLNEEILPQSLIYTRWLYVDCIADYHNVEIYSEEHWNLIEKYIAQAVDVGINMILVPVHTPPLDTAIGTTRPCVQLVDVKKNGDVYTFGFEKFKRFIDICKKCGVKYFEIAHMFSQWGAKFAPNIMVEENGKLSYGFGWHVAADSDEYVSFLKQYITAISAELRAKGIEENTYFHISDEPSIAHMDAYKRAYDIIKPLIGKSKTFDALSDYEFYKNGLVECPVTGIAHIDEFLSQNIENQWLYYCCSPQHIYSNSFIAMPSSRVRILGMLIYKYDIKGFLHWGLNFYNSMLSRYQINPYSTTSADGCYPSGDPFILYPSKDGAYNSIRGKVFYDAIEDINVCRTLEKYIGREKVVKLIDSAAGGELRFDSYPVDNEYILCLREKMEGIIKEQL